MDIVLVRHKLLVRRTALLIQIAGNFVGPLLFKPKDAPVYAPGFIAVLATSIGSAILAVVYRYVCIWENHRRDKTGTLEGFDHAYEDDHTDMTNPQFRYTY